MNFGKRSECSRRRTERAHVSKVHKVSIQLETVLNVLSCSKTAGFTSAHVPKAEQNNVT